MVTPCFCAFFVQLPKNIHRHTKQYITASLQPLFREMTAKELSGIPPNDVDTHMLQVHENIMLKHITRW